VCVCVLVLCNNTHTHTFTQLQCIILIIVIIVCEHRCQWRRRQSRRRHTVVRVVPTVHCPLDCSLLSPYPAGIVYLYNIYMYIYYVLYVYTLWTSETVSTAKNNTIAIVLNDTERCGFFISFFPSYSSSSSLRHPIPSTRLVFAETFPRQWRRSTADRSQFTTKV